MLLSILLACDPASQTDTAPAVSTEPAEPEAVGRCIYTNPFSGSDECKEYLGDGWDGENAAADCVQPVVGGGAGLFEADLACERDTILGECVVDAGGATENVLVFPGEDASSCGGLELGCSFAGGEFIPAGACLDGGSGGGGGGEVFKPFEQVCEEPLEGEPDGLNDGLVCTWEAISGCTEPGRKFTDYASCDAVLTQRPYWSYTVDYDTPDDDPRLSDDDWRAEMEWVTGQVEASACVCCHTAENAPNGPSGWYLEAGEAWIDTIDDDGLAMMAGWVDSTAFGAFDAEDNNGFDRNTTGLPTTDVVRMQAFLTGELSRRGFEEADFAQTSPFGGPLYDQLFYSPSACEDGEGVDAEGVVTWSGGSARYVYVMEADSGSPGVPPNLDLPDGTLWRLDVSYTDEAISSGIDYGAEPAGTTQSWPILTPAPELLDGQTYYLVALKDVYQPITRCLFTAGQ